MTRIAAISILMLTYFCSFGQNTIQGTFQSLAQQPIKLYSFDGFEAYLIDSVRANENGVFELHYGKKHYGMGYLSSSANKPFFVVLSGEPTKLKGETFAKAESIEIVKGKENLLFAQYATEHPRREQALSAWGYLEKIYNQDSLFAIQIEPRQAIAAEKERIKKEDSLFLANLPPDSYMSYYLPLRKLVSSVSTVAQYRTEEIPSTIAAFRNIDYLDPRLYKSGLLRDVIDSHFWLLENSGRSLDSVYIEMNNSIDHMLASLMDDEKKLNEITEYLFKLLEKRSLFKASEYLALKLLNNQACTINSDFASQLESYRAMKKGNTAPDFTFPEELLAPNYQREALPRKLSDINSEYTVLVFGAGWCPKCGEELQTISSLYEKWKEYGVELVFVSLDENKQSFHNFAGNFPFISVCDYQKWESPIVKAYHVFATPTLYLLDNERKIILKPNSVKQLDAWVDWYLVQGNW